MRNKYGNKKVEVFGLKFDSKKEANYYLYLLDRQRKKEITELRCQVPFELIPAINEEQVVHLKTKDKFVTKCVQKAVHYVADFVYIDASTGEQVVVDTKGFRTEAYKLKKKMMRAFYNINIKEV